MINIDLEESNLCEVESERSVEIIEEENNDACPEQGNDLLSFSEEDNFNH